VEYLCCRCLMGGSATRPQERPGVTENRGGAMGAQAPRLRPASPPMISGASDTRKRDGGTELPLATARRRLWKTNGFGGRPRVSVAERGRKARERTRAYRARRQGML